MPSAEPNGWFLEMLATAGAKDVTLAAFALCALR